ncbi:MAG: serine/threonine protein kinase, partial [candidate division Zixibacteria bacterium]|nr:serine/threonine protein kinase [candidate division Zixibacteria bacterium]
MAAVHDEDDRTRSYVALGPGSNVSHYKIERRIGSGGMGEVYLAEDTALKRGVALKFIPTHLMSVEGARARFKREAQSAAALNHPNIITIYEVSEYQGRPFFAMEHIEGPSLRDLIKGKELSLSKVLDFAVQISEGLREAHEKGVVHRDIKPSNIVLDKKGRCVILDFGLAVALGDEKLTKTGSTLGTVGYMSPEQAEGGHTDHRSDMFSFGVLIYEMLTCQQPFYRETEAATLQAIVNSKPEPMARFKSDVPEDLQRIVDKALEKDPEMRYQHV